MESRIQLIEEEDGRFSAVLCGIGVHLPAVTPAEDLIAASEIDYTAYRREIKRLRDEHPLFDEHLDISTADLEDLTAEALLLPSMIKDADPVSFYALGILLSQVLEREDDGSAEFLLETGAELLYVLEEPIRTQVCLRNIMEMTFDGMERATQKERFEKLRATYPDIVRHCDPALLGGIPEGQRRFNVHSLFVVWSPAAGACALLPAGGAAYCQVRLLLGLLYPKDKKDHPVL